MVFPVFLRLSLKKVKISPVSIMYADIFSMFRPTIKEVMVVAILLPNMIPMLLLKVKSLAFIKLIVSIITAELDCIIVVAKKPVLKLFIVEEVMLFSFCFTLFIDKCVRHFDK